MAALPRRLPFLRFAKRSTAGSAQAAVGTQPVFVLWRWAVLGAVVGGLLALLLFAPARWLAGVVQQASGGQVQLVDARGSVWRGAARLVLTGGAGSLGATALPGIVSWRIGPSLFTGSVRVQVQAECCMAQPLQLQLTPMGWGGAARLKLADNTSDWPAELLAGLGTPWNTVQPQGRLRLDTKGVQLLLPGGGKQAVFSGTVQIDALAVSSRLSTLRPMGSYRLLITSAAATAPGPASTPARLELLTLDGSLQLTGQGQWGGGQRLRFEGIASAAPERVEALSNLLNIIGRRSGARAIIKIG